MNAQPARDFASVLNDILVESRLDEQGPGLGPTPTVDYLAVAEELLSGRIVVDEDAAAVYRENGGDDYGSTIDAFFEAAPIVQVEPAEAELPSVEPEAITRELGLVSTTPPAELARLRRAFAFKNHPDRVAPHLRQRAQLRMQVANMLIDDARRKAAAAHG
jgi:hypothetical protein